MIDDERTRLCGGCSNNVYNLSAMSQSEAESFLQNATELPYLKFYRRHNGTIMFDNCPKDLKIASLELAFSVSSISAFAEQKSGEAASNFNLIWTLSEAGPTERAPIKITKPAPGSPLVQLGFPDRYAFFENMLPGDQTKGVGADWSGAEAFSDALE
jgi:hypothetical protein